MKRALYLLEYLPLRLVVALADALPPAATDRLARGLADLAYAAAPGRRRVARENILHAGFAATPAEAGRLARASFRHFAAMVVETLRAPRLFAGPEGARRVRADLPPALDALLDDPRRGLILATGHLGNWEIAGRVLAARKPVVGIARPMSNPYVEALVQRRAPAGAFRMIPRHDADAARFPRVLAEGGVLAFMIDQHGGRRGMAVDFFGRPASTHTAVALLHLVTRAPLFFGYCLRTGPGAFEMKAAGPIETERTGRREEDVRRVLARLNAELEAAVRRAPDQYMWGHRRWRAGDAAPGWARP